MPYLTLSCGSAVRRGIRYRAVAAYKNCLYLPVSGRQEVDVLNQDTQCIHTISVCRRYSALCFDISRCCFWAFSPACPGKLFCLDSKELFEIGCLPLISPDGTPIYPSSLSCVDDQTLQACGSFGQIHISTLDGSVRSISGTCHSECRAVQHLCGGMLTALCTRSGSSLCLQDSFGREIARCALPACLFPEDLSLCGDCSQGSEGYLLSTLGNCSCLLRFCVCSFSPACNPQPAVSCCAEACEIIHSVACIESALALILSAEGEHLLTSVRSGASSNEMLYASESARKTIDSIFFLEQLLLGKLNAAKPLCSPCREPNEQTQRLHSVTNKEKC